MLVLGVFLASCASGGSETTTDTPTAWPTPTFPSVAEIEELATENAEQTLRQMVSFSTTIEEMAVTEAADLLRELGVGNLTVVEEKQTCPPRAFGCGALAFAADEVGYLWMARGPAIDYQGGTNPIPDIVAWAWVSETAWIQGDGLVDVD